MNTPKAQPTPVSHTPGPWTVEHNVKAGGVTHLAVTARHAGKDWMPCSITPEEWARPIDLANARLIASAPALLEALQTMTDSYAKAMKDAGVTHYPEALAIVRKAREVIAQTTGN